MLRMFSPDEAMSPLSAGHFVDGTEWLLLGHYPVM